MLLNKKGLSPVIAVVLLIMVTIVAAGIIVAFVVPFVSNNLNTGGECFDVIGDLSFDETPFNCYNVTESQTGFSVRIDNDAIVGFRVSLQAQGSANAYDIEQTATGDPQFPELKMLSSLSNPTAFNDPLLIPQTGGVRTYVADGIFDKAELFPILDSGNKCDLADQINFDICTDPDAGQLVAD